MNFELPDTANQLIAAVHKWIDAEMPRRGLVAAFDEVQWKSFLQWELLHPDFGDYLHRCVGLMESARAGLPGPVLEGFLAAHADRSGRAAGALQDGKVVTSVLADRPGPLLVGWGGVADLVIDQQTGDVLSDTALPSADLSYPVPHGWLTAVQRTSDDAMRADRWLIGAALLSGLVDGALALTTEHVLGRQQFGKPLAAFQGVQLPLAELKVWADGLRLSVLDTAGLRDRSMPQWELSAAMTWLVAARASERATKVCHQSFGASGFCNETGLVQLTWAMSWLRLSVGVASAQERVLGSRRHYLDGHQSVEPGCLVLEGSATA
jgi:hypothetical protein